MSEQHKFLSVAHDMGKLEIEHAFHVFQEQGMQDPNHRIPVGDLAVRHKFLRPYDIGTILAEQRRRRTSIDYHGDKDILSEFEHKFLTFKSSHAELATRLRIMAGVLMPVALVAAWLVSRDLQTIAAIATIYLAVYFACETIAPFFVKRQLPWAQRVSWSRLPERLVPFLFFVVLTYTLVIINEPRNAARTLKLAVSIGSLIVMFCSVFVVSKWRHRRLQFFTARSHLMRDVVVVATQAAVQAGGFNDRVRVVERLLDSAALVLQVNPWAQLALRILRRKRRIVPVSLWYHELDSDDRNRFKILAFAAPGASSQVMRCLDQIKANFHASAHDDAAFQRNVYSHSHDNSLDLEAVKKEYGDNVATNLRTSLVGWVYLHKRALSSETAIGSIVFDKRFIKVGESAAAGLEEAERAWLDPTAFAAYPVLNPSDPEGPALGVVVVHRHGSKRLRFEDSNTLETMVDLLGFVLSSRGEAHGI